MPVLIDGFISAAAALVAARICPAVKKAMLASHLSDEPAAALALGALGLRPLITAGMCLGEGTARWRRCRFLTWRWPSTGR